VAVLEELELEDWAVVYNGAGVYCPRAERLVEERVLSSRAVARALDHARREDLLVVAMRAGRKFALPPRTPVEASAIRNMHGLEICEDGRLPDEYLIRLTLFSLDPDHVAVEERARRAVGTPVYTTSFPLSMLASHRDSPMSVVDLQPPCRGKAEALRILEERYGIERQRVVAVGDAMNDVPMLQEAGLAVAMERSSPDALAAAHRVIGDNNTGTIGELVDELFG
jgi:hydroxymethylpyrimidine pyrophosphatase-like HAD family hydrolase